MVTSWQQLLTPPRASLASMGTVALFLCPVSLSRVTATLLSAVSPSPASVHLSCAEAVRSAKASAAYRNKDVLAPPQHWMPPRMRFWFCFLLVSVPGSSGSPLPRQRLPTEPHFRPGVLLSVLGGDLGALGKSQASRCMQGRGTVTPPGPCDSRDTVSAPQCWGAPGLQPAVLGDLQVGDHAGLSHIPGTLTPVRRLQPPAQCLNTGTC